MIEEHEGKQHIPKINTKRNGKRHSKDDSEHSCKDSKWR